MGASDSRRQQDRETRLSCLHGEIHAIPLILNLQAETITGMRMLVLTIPSN
jgi:hypothetical protein